MKTTTINGTAYRFKAFDTLYNGITDIFELYDRPSTTKVAIFREWEEKLDTIYGMCGNSCTFSIYGAVKDEQGDLHDVKITARHNYIK